MKKAGRILLSVFLLVIAFQINAQAKEGDFFIGKWKVLVEGTPQGDATMIITFERNEKGEIVGTNSDEKGETPAINFNRVEVSEESITAYWVAQGYDVYLFLEKINEKEVEGSLMDMFDATGERMKE